MRRSYVEIVELDVRIAVCRSLLVLRAPDTDYEYPFHHPIVMGELAVVGTRFQPYFLVNWKTQTALVLLVEPVRGVLNCTVSYVDAAGRTHGRYRRL
jgi:hypothetical protein